jgi:hypothetical protein
LASISPVFPAAFFSHQKNLKDSFRTADICPMAELFFELAGPILLLLLLSIGVGFTVWTAGRRTPGNY